MMSFIKHPEYPDWTITHRFLVDSYPLLMLENDDQKIFISEGYYKNIIEFLLAISEPVEMWLEDPKKYLDEINYILHMGFISELGWAEGQGTFYGHLVQPEEFEAWKVDGAFLEEMERYQNYVGKPLNEAVWEVCVSSGSWRGSAKFIVQSSIQKMITLRRNFLAGETQLPEGVIAVSV